MRSAFQGQSKRESRAGSAFPLQGDEKAGASDREPIPRERIPLFVVPGPLSSVSHPRIYETVDHVDYYRECYDDKRVDYYDSLNHWIVCRVDALEEQHSHSIP